MDEDKIPVYRANPKNRYGATDRMETLPTMFDKATVSSFTRAAAAGQKHGVPVLPPEMIANLMLHEGREDAGFNELNHKNKKAVAIAEKLLEEGHTDEAAGFAAAIYDKMQAAKRLNKPFAELWNGTGISKDKQTGAQYAKRFEEMQYAATHPKNEGFLQYVRGHYNSMLPKTETPVVEKEEVRINPMGDTYKKGGVVHESYSKGNWKLI